MSERTCTQCGSSVEALPYEYWLFHTCRTCASERAPKRWNSTGTARKWSYYPRWHLTMHPELPAWKRERFKTGGTA